MILVPLWKIGMVIQCCVSVMILLSLLGTWQLNY